MFRTRLAAVVLSGGLMLVSGCLQLPQGPGLFARRPLASDCCCAPTCGDYGHSSMPSSCGCGSISSGTVISQTPGVMPQDGQIIMPPNYPLPMPKVTTVPNSPMVPYQGQ